MRKIIRSRDFKTLNMHSWGITTPNLFSVCRVYIPRSCLKEVLDNKNTARKKTEMVENKKESSKSNPSEGIVSYYDRFTLSLYSIKQRHHLLRC